MTTTWLTVHPLLHFDPSNWLVHAIVLRLFKFQDYGVGCGSWVGIASAAQLHIVIDDHSVGFILIADRDSIVERHEEGIGIPAKERVQSTTCAWYRWDDEAPMALTVSRVYKRYRGGGSHWIYQMARAWQGFIEMKLDTYGHIDQLPSCIYIRHSRTKDRHDARNHSRVVCQIPPMLRYWQWLNERETRSIKGSEILTCHQIGFDRQSHYAQKDVTADVAFLRPYSSQLYRHRTVSFQWYRRQQTVNNWCVLTW